MAPLVKLAQQGYDVKTAGDENLIFSSEWPLLKIYQSGPFTISDVTQQQVIATHDLGFPAVFWYFTNDTILAWENFGTLVNDKRSEFFGPTGGGTIGMTNSQLTFTPADFTATGSLQGYYYIFANDLTTQYTAPTNNIGGLPAGINPGRTFKIAKSGQSVKSTNLKDFVIHSDTRSPLIHSINPGTVGTDPIVAGGNSFTVEHDLTYVPMFFAYKLTNGVYTMIATGSGGSEILTSTSTKVTFQTSLFGQQLTIVILKDPFLVNYAVSVTQ